MPRRIVILAEGSFGPLESKTANQAIRYLPQEVVGVIDSANAGLTVKNILGFGGNIPIFQNVHASLPNAPNVLLIGVAPVGGRLPESWRPILKEAIENGLDLVSGLHTLLGEDEEIAELAKKRGVHITDLRSVPPEYSVVARGSWRTRLAKTVLTVGTDCNVGKMTAAWELHREFARRGHRSDFVATGQTGILLAGKGIAVDHLISDFVAGAIEREVDKSSADGHEVIFVEGQGSLTHQGYSSVTLGLMHGVMPDAMILVHHPARGEDDYGFRLDDINRSIRLHEELLSPFKNSKVVGIAINTVGMMAQETEKAVHELEHQTQLPVADVLSPGLPVLVESIETFLAVREALAVR